MLNRRLLSVLFLLATVTAAAPVTAKADHRGCGYGYSIRGYRTYGYHSGVAVGTTLGLVRSSAYYSIPRYPTYITPRNYTFYYPNPPFAIGNYDYGIRGYGIGGYGYGIGTYGSRLGHYDYHPGHFDLHFGRGGPHLHYHPGHYDYHGYGGFHHHHHHHHHH